MVTYSEDYKYAIIDGMSFCRDEKTGYYLNSTTHKRLHRYVYEKANGKIPKGYDVHHIDHDKRNNQPDNLALLTRAEHRKRHADEMTGEQREALRRNMLGKAIPAAAEWHSSDSGREWHKEHYATMKDALHARKQRVCKNCGKQFSGALSDQNIFCSNACAAAYRRKAGVDNEQRKCVICGAEFTTNKYSKTRCCSRSCGTRLGHQNRQNKALAAGAGL